MRQVPIYALYGERGTQPDAEFLHCETIASRSRLHGFHIRPHRHQHLFQLLFLEGGAGTVLHDGAQEALAPPCVVLMPPLVVHSYSFSNDVEGVVLTLYERELATILPAGPHVTAGLAGARVIPLADQPAAAATIARALASVAAEATGSEAGRAAMMQAHLRVALLAADRATHSAGSGAETTRGAGRVATFRRMIDVEFRSHLPVADYSRRLGMTPVHLRRLCRMHLGDTPLGAINARLLLEAKRLLVFTSLGVKEVAAELGFADHAYFSRFFQREAGVSPSAFRATRRTTAPPAEPEPPPRPADTRRETGR